MRIPTFCYVPALRSATFPLRPQCFSYAIASFWPSLCLTAAADAGPGCCCWSWLLLGPLRGLLRPIVRSAYVPPTFRMVAGKVRFGTLFFVYVLLLIVRCALLMSCSLLASSLATILALVQAAILGLALALHWACTSLNTDLITGLHGWLQN